MGITRNKLRFLDKELFCVKSSLGTVTLWSLAIPLMFESVMNNLLGTVNTAVLSGYSENAVAAVGATTTILNVLLLISSVIAMGATVVVSNAIGAENIKRARETSFMAIFACIGFVLLITPALLIFAENILGLLNLEGNILKEGLIYFKIRVGFLFITAAQSVILALLKCYGYPKYTFFVGILTNIVNLILNIYVIHLPQLSPVTGVTGVAAACIISSLSGLLVSIYLFKKTGIKIQMPEKPALMITYTKDILKVGLPSALSGGSVTIAGMVTTSFVAMIGDLALSAKVYYTNILSYAYLFSVAVGNANALLVGRRYGAGEYDKIEKMNKQLVNVTRLVNLLISLFMLVFRVRLLSLFTDSPQIIALSLGVFLVDIIAEQARAVSQVYEYALRGCGDVLFSVVILIFSCWIFSIGLAYFLAIKCEMGLVGCWIGIAADECVRMIVTYLRFKSGKWKGSVLND